MTEKTLIDQINELKSELQLKNKEISEYLDKIDYLEDTIMELEANLTKKFEKTNASVLKFRLKDIEKENRELKNKLGYLRLENVKLKQELEKIKNGQVIHIQVVEDSFTSNEIKKTTKKEAKIEEDKIPGKESFKYINIKCPICDTLKKLKIFKKNLEHSQQITTISIPKGIFCEHSFQVFLDKHLNVKSYQVANFESSKIEYIKNIEENQTTKEDLAHFKSLPFFKDLIEFLKSGIDSRDILGNAIFTNKGKVIYASIPSNTLFNVIKQFEVMKEKNIKIMKRMFFELENHQKIYSETIKIQNNEFIIVLILSKKVNFGIGSMLFKNVKEKLKTIFLKS